MSVSCGPPRPPSLRARNPRCVDIFAQKEYDDNYDDDGILHRAKQLCEMEIDGKDGLTMKNANPKMSFFILLSVVLLLILISLFVWNHIWNKVIFGCVSAVYLLISLHKFHIIVLKDNHKQSLICGLWRYATVLCFGGYIALLAEELFGA